MALDDDRLKAFIKGVVQFTEGVKDPTTANFPDVANSGLSYGTMQNDVGSNPGARDAIGVMLKKGEMSDPEWNRLEPILRTKGLTADKLEAAFPGAMDRINAAIAAHPDDVAAPDDRALSHVFNEVKRVFDAAKDSHADAGAFDSDHPDWTAVGKAAAWANQVRDLKDTAKDVAGMPEITGDAFRDLMKSRDYFRDPAAPDRYVNWAGRVVQATDKGLDAIRETPSFTPASTRFQGANGAGSEAAKPPVIGPGPGIDEANDNSSALPPSATPNLDALLGGIANAEASLRRSGFY